MVVSFKILLVVGAETGKLSGTMENVAPNALGEAKEVARVKKGLSYVSNFRFNSSDCR